MEEETKKLLFVFVFSTYLPVFLLKFRSGELVGCGIWFCIQRVPTLHTFDGPHYPKKRNTWKNVMMTSSSHFSGIYFFWGSGVCQKYAVWVLVGCRIKFCIQWSLPPSPFLFYPSRALHKVSSYHIKILHFVKHIFYIFLL